MNIDKGTIADFLDSLCYKFVFCIEDNKLFQGIVINYDIKRETIAVVMGDSLYEYELEDKGKTWFDRVESIGNAVMRTMQPLGGENEVSYF